MALVPSAIVPVGGLCGSSVQSRDGEDLGSISELMVDTASGRIAYAVLAFGGLLGVGEKLFAVPWRALLIDPSSGAVTIDVERAQLEDDPGFDKDAWPAEAEALWARLTREPVAASAQKI